MFGSGKCRHVYKVVQQDVLKSPLDRLLERGLTSLKGHDLPQLARQPVIVTRVCQECGNEEVKRV